MYFFLDIMQDKMKTEGRFWFVAGNLQYSFSHQSIIFFYYKCKLFQYISFWMVQILPEDDDTGFLFLRKSCIINNMRVDLAFTLQYITFTRPSIDIFFKTCICGNESTFSNLCLSCILTGSHVDLMWSWLSCFK